MLRLTGWVFGDAVLPPGARPITSGLVGRSAAARVLLKAHGRMPTPVDGLWSVSIRALAGFHHRPGIDGPVLPWRLRRLGYGLRRILGCGVASSVHPDRGAH
jgi:hypothetical protein